MQYSVQLFLYILYNVFTVRVRAYLRGDVASTRVSQRTVNCPSNSVSCGGERGSIGGRGGMGESDGDINKNKERMKNNFEDVD